MKRIICALLLIQGGLMMAQTTEIVPTINGKKVQIDPNAIVTADNGLTASNKNVQLGGALLKATSIVTTPSFTLALKGLETGAATDKILVADANGVLKLIDRSNLAGDNLGNHTATQDLAMSGNSIVNALNVTATGKTTTATAQITTGAGAGKVAVSDATGNVTWTDASSLGVTGDNLGNHTATQDLAMSGKSIVNALNITATGKTTTATAQITKGTDGAAAVAGYVATAADANGNIVWKPSAQKNIVPSDVGTVIAINGELLVAQEITAQMTADYVKPQSSATIFPIGNISNVIIDNKSRYSSSSTGNSFTVEANGTYLITMNVQASAVDNNATNNQAIVVGVVDNATGKWVARVNDAYMSINRLQTFTLITSVPMVTGRSYSFAISGNFTTTVYAMSSGTTGGGPVSFYSIKRLK